MSKAIDYGGEPLIGNDQQLRDASNLALERGLTTFDMRSRFVASFL